MSGITPGCPFIVNQTEEMFVRFIVVRFGCECGVSREKKFCVGKNMIKNRKPLKKLNHTFRFYLQNKVNFATFILACTHYVQFTVNRHK